MKNFQKFENLVTDASWTILKTGGAYLLGIFENFYGFFLSKSIRRVFSVKNFFQIENWNRLNVSWGDYQNDRNMAKMTVMDQNDRYSMRQ